MRGRWSEWQCAGILFQRILQRKQNISTYITRRKEKKNAEEDNGFEPEIVYDRPLGLPLTP